MSATLHLNTESGPACGQSQDPSVALTSGPDDITDTAFDLAICPRCLDIVDMLDKRNSDRYDARRAWQVRRAVHSLLRGEREESAPSTNRRAHLRGGSSLSRRDPMPALFVVGLAVVALFAIFGLLSIGQFIQRWGGQ